MAWRCRRPISMGCSIVAMHDARAFAQNIHRTHAGATGAQNIRVKNGESGAAQIAAGDFLDEARDVDVGGARGGAGRVETVEAAIRFRERGLGIERRMDFGEPSREFVAGVNTHGANLSMNAECAGENNPRTKCLGFIIPLERRAAQMVQPSMAGGVSYPELRSISRPSPWSRKSAKLARGV